jgi:hypothetical protein
MFPLHFRVLAGKIVPADRPRSSLFHTAGFTPEIVMGCGILNNNKKDICWMGFAQEISPEDTPGVSASNKAPNPPSPVRHHRQYNSTLYVRMRRVEHTTILLISAGFTGKYAV